MTDDSVTGSAARRAWRRVADDPLPFVLVALVVVLAAVLMVVSNG